MLAFDFVLVAISMSHNARAQQASLQAATCHMSHLHIAVFSTLCSTSVREPLVTWPPLLDRRHSQEPSAASASHPRLPAVRELGADAAHGPGGFLQVLAVLVAQPANCRAHVAPCMHPPTMSVSSRQRGKVPNQLRRYPNNAEVTTGQRFKFM